MHPHAHPSTRTGHQRAPRPWSIAIAGCMLIAACSSGDVPDDANGASLQDTLASHTSDDTAYFESSRRMWEDARGRGVVFRAIGQEPGWLLEVHRDRIVLSVDYDERRFNAPTPAAAVDSAGGVTTWTTTANGTDIRIEAREGECSDAMSGERFPMSATVIVAGSQYVGCGQFLNPLP